jgi:ssDNA-binding Zn-finger/Zn-ribbon topoisomerase 1
VPYGDEAQTASGEVQKVEEAAKVSCPECGADRLRRVERKGFMQERVYPLFGYFPWYCRECRQYSLLRKRSRRKSSRKQYVERGS